MKLSPPAKSSAFTLLEIMLAIGIFSGLLIAIYASWSAILRSSQIGLNVAMEAHRMRVAVRSIEESIKSAVIFELNLPLYSFMHEIRSDFAYFSLTSRLSDSFPGSGLFYDQPIRRVSFVVEDGEQGGQLVMQQRPILTPLEEGEESYSIVLLKNVDVFALEFWDAQLSDWSPEWIYTNRFPAMIRYSLAVAPPGRDAAEENSIIQRIVHVPAATVQANWQRPAMAGEPSKKQPTPTN